VRKKLIPHFDDLKTASLRAGALGGGISGSGPSVFMLSDNYKTAVEVENRMREIYSLTGIEFNLYVSEILPGGVKIKAESSA
jgi:homoserine kinase